VETQKNKSWTKGLPEFWSNLIFWMGGIVALTVWFFASAILKTSDALSVTGIIVIFVVYIVARAIYLRLKINYDEDDDKLRNLATCVLASAYVLFSINLNVQGNPFGGPGTMITFAACLIALGIKFYPYESNKDFVVASYEALEIVFCIGLVAELYVLWGTQWVWVPIALYLVTAVTDVWGDFDLDYTEDFLHPVVLGVFGIIVGIGVLNTILQFWNSPFLWGYQFGGEFLIAVSVLAVILGVKLSINALKSYRFMEMRAENLTYVTSLLISRNEFLEEDVKRSRCIEMVRRLEHNVRVTVRNGWYDMKVPYDKAKEHGVVVLITQEYERVSKMTLLELIDQSKMHQKLHFDGDVMEFALETIAGAIRRCTDEKVMNELRVRVQELKNLPKKYDGYGALMALINHAGINGLLLKVKVNQQ
jgi:hypothetical protein